MRNQFAETMTLLAQENPDIVLLSGDIGNRLFDNYKKAASERFFNCGIAEANMVTMAAGLAHSGMRPVAYTITPFITTRCLEQIKVDVCYHNLPVVLVGTGSGLSYAELGATHHSCEDIAIMRAMPNMTVICAADRNEVRLALEQAVKLDSPVYLRIGKKNEPDIHSSAVPFKIGESIKVRSGHDICLLATGNMVAVAIETADILEQSGLSVQVVSMHTVKPLDQNRLTDVVTRFPLIATLEEHNHIGGFGSAVAEWLVDSHQLNTRLIRFSTPDEFISNVSSQQEARERYGLNAQQIAQSLRSDFTGLSQEGDNG